MTFRNEEIAQALFTKGFREEQGRHGESVQKPKLSFHATGFSPQLMTQPKASHYGLQSVVDEITKAVHATGFNP